MDDLTTPGGCPRTTDMTNSQYIVHMTVRAHEATITFTLVHEPEGFFIRETWRGDGGCHLRGPDIGPYVGEVEARGVLNRVTADRRAAA